MRKKRKNPPTLDTPIKVGRNDPCPCGSGKKYKHCCEQKNLNRANSWTSWLGIILVLTLVVGSLGIVTAAFFSESGCSPSGRVWSPEHGHWHDAP